MLKKTTTSLMGVVAVTALLGSCTTVTTMASCSGPARQVTIFYGDSEIRVAPPVIKLARQEELRFRLQPDKKASDEVDFDTVLVTVKGKESDPDASWIDASGTYKDSGGYLGVCVPSGQAHKTYRYYVDVNTVGKIDPRARVQ
jgi:hypothetical protein